MRRPLWDWRFDKPEKAKGYAMTTRFAIVLVVTLLAAACGSQPEQQPLSPNTVEAAASETNAEDERLKSELAFLKKEFDESENRTESLMSAAKGELICDTNYRFESYVKIKQAYDNLLRDKPGAANEYTTWAHNLDLHINELGRDISSKSYADLKTGKVMLCDTWYTDDETAGVEKWVEIIEKYGLPNDAKPDPQVIRQAYLGALKNDIAKGLPEIKELGDDAYEGEGQPDAIMLIRQGRDQWRFSAQQMGVPNDIYNRVP